MSSILTLVKKQLEYNTFFHIRSSFVLYVVRRIKTGFFVKTYSRNLVIAARLQLDQMRGESSAIS